MRASNYTFILSISILVVLLLVTGCKPAANTEVVIESEGPCTISEIKSISDGMKTIEADVENVFRAVVMNYTIDCGHPYVKETCIDVQDHFINGPITHITSSVECVTTEGGIWKGTCDGTEDVSNVCTTVGEGKYKGLQLTTNVDLKTMVMKYRVIKLSKE
jgi:hypothetical protein